MWCTHTATPSIQIEGPTRLTRCIERRLNAAYVLHEREKGQVVRLRGPPRPLLPASARPTTENDGRFALLAQHVRVQITFSTRKSYN